MTDAGNNRVRVECPHCGKEAYSIPTACSRCGAPGGDHTGSCMAAARADATRNSAAETKARAMLYQAVWETSQFCDFAEIRRIVEGTLHNIAGDEP